jgi:maltose alpha-D-glucosyltransferase/alpha-amylase
MIEYRRTDDAAATFVSAQRFVPNEGDAWNWTLDELGDYLERAITRAEAPDVGPASTASLVERASQPTPDAAREAIGSYLDRVLPRSSGGPGPANR